MSQNQAPSHSPTPWRNDARYASAILDANGQYVCSVSNIECAEAQAHRVGTIIKAVNSHAALVEALRGMVALVERVQAVTLNLLLPDSGVSDHDALNDVIYALDCPEQNAAQSAAHAALAAEMTP